MLDAVPALWPEFITLAGVNAREGPSMSKSLPRLTLILRLLQLAQPVLDLRCPLRGRGGIVDSASSLRLVASSSRKVWRDGLYRESWRRDVWSEGDRPAPSLKLGAIRRS